MMFPYDRDYQELQTGLMSQIWWWIGDRLRGDRDNPPAHGMVATPPEGDNPHWEVRLSCSALDVEIISLRPTALDAYMGVASALDDYLSGEAKP